MDSVQDFVQMFQFDESKAFNVGVERESFLCSMDTNVVVPEAYTAYKVLRQSSLAQHFTPELSACQIEYRTSPVLLPLLQIQLEELDKELQRLLSTVGLYGDYIELAPDSIPTAVYPNQRGKDVSERLTKETLLAACRVAGTHVHVGMPDLETAILVYNHVIKHLKRLIQLGDFSAGERLRLYMLVAGSPFQGMLGGEEHFYSIAIQEQFAANPRDWWALVRISVHGTIEFRPFGSVASADTIVNWASYCHYLCLEALAAKAA